MIILGIDPGTTRLGYGVIEKNHGTKFLTCGVIGDSRIGKSERLFLIQKRVNSLIKEFRPELISLEHVFFSKNKKTALSIAEVRGVILALAQCKNIPVVEFTPNNIKRVVAGDGSCDKTVLAQIVAVSLKMKSAPKEDDASDALAVAIRASFEILHPE
jgi:crossover junction endodeoxyribonuclease RuvC